MSVPFSLEIFDDLKEPAIFLSLALKRFLHLHEVGPGIIQCYFPRSTTTTTIYWDLGLSIASNPQIYIYIYI